LSEWVRFPGVDADMILTIEPDMQALPKAIGEEFVEEGRYAPYVERQLAEIQSISANAAISIPDDVDYSAIGGLSAEMVERLSAARPENLGAAERVRGVTPAAVAAILVHVQRRRRSAAAA
jgi:tRNA uridine 5-carboxymethylaminomethyl modification enzyme